MELRHLRYFVAVAEALNFRKAAEKLFLSQPTLSTQIRQLEKELDVPLLRRDTHQVSLTAAGEYFLESCRHILREVETAALTAHRISTRKAGKLSIGFVESLGHNLLPRILRAYRAQFPDVELRLVQMETTGQIEALNARQLDVGLVGLGLSTTFTDLQLTTIDEEELMAVLHEDHPLLKKYPRSLPLAALASEHFYLAERSSAPLYNPWILVLCQQAGFTPHLLEESGQPTTVLGYVAAGLGVTILPAQFAQLSTVGVRFLPLDPPLPRYRYCAAWAPQNSHAALAHFVKVAESIVADKPGE